MKKYEIRQHNTGDLFGVVLAESSAKALQQYQQLTGTTWDNIAAADLRPVLVEESTESDQYIVEASSEAAPIEMVVTATSEAEAITTAQAQINNMIKLFTEANNQAEAPADLVSKYKATKLEYHEIDNPEADALAAASLTPEYRVCCYSLKELATWNLLNNEAIAAASDYLPSTIAYILGIETEEE